MDKTVTKSCLLETTDGQDCEEGQACWRLTMDKAVRKVMIVGDSEDCEEGQACWRLTMDKAVRKVMIVGDSEDCEEGHDSWRLPRL